MPENDQSDSLIPQTKKLTGAQGELSANESPRARACRSTETTEGEGGRDCRDKRMQIKDGPINRIKALGDPTFVGIDHHDENCKEREPRA